MGLVYLTGMYAHNGRCEVIHKPVADLPSVERYSDEEIDRWAEIYTVNRLHARGILFATFLRCPQEMLRAALRSDRGVVDMDYSPLLPAQLAVAERIAGEHHTEDAMLPDAAVLRGDHYVEPLRHHAWDVSTQRHRNHRTG